jgi:hypothetical protein
MNPALHAAINSAAKAHKDLLTQFKDASAFSPDTALLRSQFGSEHKMMIDYYLKRDILKASSGDRIYLNRRAYEDHKASMKSAGIWFGMIFGLAGLIGILLLLANKL